MKKNILLHFKELDLTQKIFIFDDNIEEVIIQLNKMELYRFFKNIILEKSENSYVRIKALEGFVNCVILGILKPRQAVSILLDEWETECDIFLESIRLKNLFLFYEYEPEDIVSCYNNYTTSSELDLVSESYYNLGLVNLLKGFDCKTKIDIVSSVNISNSMFKKSLEYDYNRIDSLIYEKATSIIVSLLENESKDLDKKFQIFADLLFYKEMYAFRNDYNHFYLILYKSMINLVTLIKNKPEDWLNFKTGIDEVYNSFSQLLNQSLKFRVKESNLSSKYKMMLKEQFIEPYFTINFDSEINRIDLLLKELDSNDDKYEFLKYVRNLTEGTAKRRKYYINDIETESAKLFPNRSPEFIGMNCKKIINPHNPNELLNLFENLSKFSFEYILDIVITACLKLQGNKLYRGDCLENDRNTFIASMIESSGIRVKDQTRWSLSNQGKDAGEIDIFIYEKDGRPFSIIEALNLDSLKKDYLSTHLNKIFKYDANGFENNFILVYSTSKNFTKFWFKYFDFVKTYNYVYPLINLKEVKNYEYINIRICKTKHKRLDKIVNLLHLVIDLSYVNE